MTAQQKDVVLQALEQCSLPLYTRIAYDYIRKWHSYDTPSLEMLQVTVKGNVRLFYSLDYVTRRSEKLEVVKNDSETY